MNPTKKTESVSASALPPRLPFPHTAHVGQIVGRVGEETEQGAIQDSLGYGAFRQGWRNGEEQESGDVNGVEDIRDNVPSG